MSCLWLKLITILCLSCTALGGTESSGVVWKVPGEAITIQCRSPEIGQTSLTLMKRGLSQEFPILFKDSDSGKNIINNRFTDRLQENGPFPNVDIFIKNLTSDDTGIYWCSYTKFDEKDNKVITEDGEGSVLLVLTDKSTNVAMECEPSDKNLVLVSVVIAAAVLLGIIMGFLIWVIIKTRTLCSIEKPRRVATNDVYEDMRGTLRR